MKVTKVFCIDDDLLKDLKKLNASELVNSLLREHIEGISAMSLSKLKQILSEKKAKKAHLLKEIRETTRKIAEIEAKEAKILRISKQYPDYVFRTIEGCSNLMSFYASFRNDKRLRAFGWGELKKLFIHLKGGSS